VCHRLSSEYFNSPNANAIPSANNDNVAQLATPIAGLVVLEKRGVPVALSDAGSAGRERKASVIFFLKYRNNILSRRSKREGILVCILFVNTRRKLVIHEQKTGQNT
jgi:hypothetical protein